MSEDLDPTLTVPPPAELAADAAASGASAAAYGYGQGPAGPAGGVPPVVVAAVTEDHRAVGKVVRHCVVTFDNVGLRVEKFFLKRAGAGGSLVDDSTASEASLDRIEEISALVAAKRGLSLGSIPEAALLLELTDHVTKHAMNVIAIRKAAPRPAAETPPPRAAEPTPVADLAKARVEELQAGGRPLSSANLIS
jgi:hypothetical protein